MITNFNQDLVNKSLFDSMVNALKFSVKNTFQSDLTICSYDLILSLLYGYLNNKKSVYLPSRESEIELQNILIKIAKTARYASEEYLSYLKDSFKSDSHDLSDLSIDDYIRGEWFESIPDDINVAKLSKISSNYDMILVGRICLKKIIKMLD